MKTLYNILVPKFLQRFDDYLLHQYPVVWRTKSVFVLFYGFFGAVVLFTAGFLYPVDAQHLTVLPTVPILIINEGYYLWVAFFVIIGVLYWAYRQYELGFYFTKQKETVMTLLLYASSLYVLFGFTIPAFRLGTIVKTAYYWIDEKDMHELENSSIYPYGFVLLHEDTICGNTVNDTFFQKREAILRELTKIEDNFLLNLYTFDDSVDIQLKQAVHENKDEDKDEDEDSQEEKRESARSYFAPKLFGQNLEYQNDLLKFSQKIYSLQNKPSLSHTSYKISEVYKCRCANHYTVNNYKDSLSMEFMIRYSQYKKLMPVNPNFTKYNFTNESASINIYKYFIKSLSYPTLPNSIENAVRSVKNARLYLQEDVYIKHLNLLFSYILLLSLLLFFLPLISLKPTVFLLSIQLVIITSIFDALSHTVLTFQRISFLIFPIISLIWLGLSVFRKKYLKKVDFAIHNLFVGIFFVLSFVLLNNLDLDDTMLPLNFSFYGVQVLGLLGALLTTYVRTLPKQ